MKRLCGVMALVLAMTATARGHFIFIVPANESRTAKVVFSDSTKPDKAEYLKKIAHTTFAVRDAKGKETSLKAKSTKDSISVTAPGKGTVWVVASCPYGVITKGKTPFLLNYYAKSAIGFDAENPPGKEVLTQTSKKMPLDIHPILGEKPQAKIIFNGKALADAEVVVLVPGKDDAVTLKTDKDGLVDLPGPKGSGVYAIRAGHIEKKKGKLGDKSYDEIRHYVTLTAYVKHD